MTNFAKVLVYKYLINNNHYLNRFCKNCGMEHTTIVSLYNILYKIKTFYMYIRYIINAISTTPSDILKCTEFLFNNFIYL